MRSIITNGETKMIRRMNNNHRPAFIAASLAALLAIVASGPFARADIFQWEYINPANPSQGKQQSTTLCGSGAGVNAVPGVDLSFHGLTMAYLIGADLTGAKFGAASLYNADLSEANLTNAYFGPGSFAGNPYYS
jgi:hypothetical protein